MATIRYLGKAGMMAGLLLLAITSCTATIKVEVNGSPISFSVSPRQINGRTMVPLRSIFEALGAQVSWDSTIRMISATSGDTDVHLSIGDRNATVNGQTVHLDTPAMIVNGSTMVPLRFVSEALGAYVNWSESTQTVTITTRRNSSTDVPSITMYNPT